MSKKIVYLIVLIVFVVITATLAFFVFKPEELVKVKIVDPELIPTKIERIEEKILEDLRPPEGKEVPITPEEQLKKQEQRKKILEDLRSPERKEVLITPEEQLKKQEEQEKTIRILEGLRPPK